jgi:LCP family protein required for cell wall assembly
MALVLSTGAGGLAYFLPAAEFVFNSTGQVAHVPSPSPTDLFIASPSPTPVANIGGALTVLLLGSDNDQKFDPNHQLLDHGVLTQSMILVRVVPSTNQVVMLSIPRDMAVPLSVGGTRRISEAYSLGGPGAAIATVQNAFHVHVDDYIWVGLLGLIRVIDAMGGIDVVTSHPVLDDYYPMDIFSSNPWGYQRVAVLAGPQHLDGIHAMQYVRSRHGDRASDIGRSVRQQQVLMAIRHKAKHVPPADLPVLAEAIGGELKTSIKLDRVAQLLPLAASFDNPDVIQNITLGSPYTHGGNQDETLTPNWDLILPLVRQYFP